MNTRKFHLPGEAALLIVLLINPLAIDLMSKSVFGISTISSVPLILSTAFQFSVSERGTISFKRCLSSP